VSEEDANTAEPMARCSTFTAVASVRPRVCCRSATVSGKVPGPLPAQIPPPYGIAVDPATGDIFITIDDAIMTLDFTK
jgi:hypothetical protein